MKDGRTDDVKSNSSCTQTSIATTQSTNAKSTATATAIFDHSQEMPRRQDEKRLDPSRCIIEKPISQSAGSSGSLSSSVGFQSEEHKVRYHAPMQTGELSNRSVSEERDTNIKKVTERFTDKLPTTSSEPVACTASLTFTTAELQHASVLNIASSSEANLRSDLLPKEHNSSAEDAEKPELDPGPVSGIKLKQSVVSELLPAPDDVERSSITTCDPLLDRRDSAKIVENLPVQMVVEESSENAVPELPSNVDETVVTDGCRTDAVSYTHPPSPRD